VSVYLNPLILSVRASFSQVAFLPAGSSLVGRIITEKDLWVLLMSADYNPKLHLAASLQTHFQILAWFDRERQSKNAALPTSSCPPPITAEQTNENIE